MKKQMLPVLLTAALGCFVFAGCGDTSTAEHGAETTSTRRVTETTATTGSTADSTVTTTETTVRTEDTDILHDNSTRTEERTDHGILDDAESMLDDMGDTVTSVLTEATREIHNND